jgi:hypothetical protein
MSNEDRKWRDERRNIHIECMVNAIVKAGLQLREGLGISFTGVPFYAPGGHEVTAESIDVESILDSEFRKGQLGNRKLREKSKTTLLNIMESSDIQKELVQRYGDKILDPTKRDEIEFVISDCPDGSTKHGNYSKASRDGIGLSGSPPTSINMTLYEKGTRFKDIRANITYTLDGDLIIVRKNDNDLTEFMIYNNIHQPIAANVHPKMISAERLQQIYAQQKGTICAAIMTNDNYGCNEVSEAVRQNLREKVQGIDRVRFESTGSSILDHHLSIYRGYSHLLIDLRGLSPDKGAVIHPSEAGAHYLAFKELGWICKFRDTDGEWKPLDDFDLLNNDYRLELQDGTIQYKLSVAYFSPNLPDVPFVQQVVTESVNSVITKGKR